MSCSDLAKHVCSSLAQFGVPYLNAEHLIPSAQDWGASSGSQVGADVSTAFSEDVVDITRRVWDEHVEGVTVGQDARDAFWQNFPNAFREGRIYGLTTAVAPLLAQLSRGQSVDIPINVDGSDDGSITPVQTAVTVMKLTDTTVSYGVDDEWYTGSAHDAVQFASKLDDKLRTRRKWRNQWDVPSASEDGKTWTVSQNHDGSFVCHCWPYRRKGECRHIDAVKDGQHLPRGVEPKVEPPHIFANVLEVTPETNADGTIKRIQVPLVPFNELDMEATIIFDCLRHGVSWQTLKESRPNSIIQNNSRKAIISHVYQNGRCTYESYQQNSSGGSSPTGRKYTHATSEMLKALGVDG